MEKIESFVRRVRRSTQAKSKEIRLSIADAQDLVFELTQLLIRENQLLEELNNKPAEKEKSEVIAGVYMDGGKF